MCGKASAVSFYESKSQGDKVVQRRYRNPGDHLDDGGKVRVTERELWQEQDGSSCDDHQKPANMVGAALEVGKARAGNRFWSFVNMFQ